MKNKLLLSDQYASSFWFLRYGIHVSEQVYGHMHCTFVGDYWEDMFSKNMSNVHRKNWTHVKSEVKIQRLTEDNAPTTLPGLSLWLAKEDHLDICVR